MNWADLTATVANPLYPHQVLMLKTLVLAGDAVPDEYMQRWLGHARLISCYGPVESGNYIAYEFQNRHSIPLVTIGHVIDMARCWIVNPQNSHRLASVWRCRRYPGRMADPVMRLPRGLLSYSGRLLKRIWNV